MNRPAPHFPLSLLIALLLAALPIGCSNYQSLSNASTDQTLRFALPPILQEAGPPGLIAPLTRNLRSALLQSSAIDLRPPAAGIPLLEVRIREADRRGMARDPRDSGRPFSFQEVLRIQLHWQSHSIPPPWGSDAVYSFEHTVHLYTLPSTVEARQSALPEIARDIAGRIVRLMESPTSAFTPHG